MSDFNIVVAHFGHHNRVVMTDTLYQYDYGQQLKIEGITALPQTFQAHFSNVQHGGVSITVTGINGVVDVPNSLLMTGRRVYCWIYVTETGSGETVYQILMPVQSRPMPEYYDVEDVGVFDSVVNQVAGYAATATTGATSATASATAAAGSETAAAASASAAADSAENAAASEANAEASASAAQASDASAATAATTATAKAAEAAQSATSAGSAASRAEAAQDAAETAQTAAETAATSATADAATASTKATAAAASATTASTKATDATNAATTATAQAVAAEAAKTTAVEAKTAAQSAQSAAETAATTATAKATEAAASATAAAQAAASINTPDTELSNTSTNAVQNKVITGEITDVKTAIDALKITDTASGEIASFPDGAAMPMEGLTVEMKPIQDGTGDPSPDNIRPITGRDIVTVTRTGKNLFDKSAAIFGVLNASGNIISTTQVVKKVSDFIPVVPGGKYYAQNVIPGSDGRRGFWYDASKTGLSAVTLANNLVTSGIFTAPSDAAYIRISAYAASVDTTMLEVGELKSDYEPYDGQSATIQLGQTVYGGTMDVTTGVMTVDRAMVTFDGSSDRQWTLQDINSYGIANFHTEVPHYPIANYKTACNMLAPQSSSILDTSTEGYYVHQNGVTIYIRISADRASTVDEWKAWLAQNPLQLVYDLAEPITIQLTPAQLSTLKGQNNVWSDADSVTVEYVADPKLYIARLTEPDADMVADANITSGSYFMVGNNLYLATANIASGANIVPGVNCTKTNLAAALNAINS